MHFLFSSILLFLFVKEIVSYNETCVPKVQKVPLPSITNCIATPEMLPMSCEGYCRTIWMPTLPPFVKVKNKLIRVCRTCRENGTATVKVDIRCQTKGTTFQVLKEVTIVTGCVCRNLVSCN